MKLEQRYIILKQTDLDRAPLTEHMNRTHARNDVK